MDPLLLPLLEMGSTGALVAVVLTGFKFVESRANKRNGGNLAAKVALLEAEVKKQAVEIASMKETLEEFHDSFREFREEVRLTWAKEKAREDAIREMRQ
jgi:vacuolar-type H+-ATPase subunit I/STV1